MVVRLFVLDLAGKTIDYFATRPVGKSSESMLRHANTMPTHAYTIYKTMGLPTVLSIFLACVGIVLACLSID